MSFVLDTTVHELLRLHAESRACGSEVINQTIDAANDLSGESFSGSTPLTNLSGGQTRALMVADTAIICRSPVVLLDELENAGIDRRKAFDLLVSNDKIVLLSTHDPVLALLAERRICMSNGAMNALRIRSEKETALLETLEKMDMQINRIRSQIRVGEEITLSSDDIYSITGV
jgi:ABC-type lipoprotein export system ATPase subunit